MKVVMLCIRHLTETPTNVSQRWEHNKIQGSSPSPGPSPTSVNALGTKMGTTWPSCSRDILSPGKSQLCNVAKHPDMSNVQILYPRRQARCGISPTTGPVIDEHFPFLSLTIIADRLPQQ